MQKINLEFWIMGRITEGAKVYDYLHASVFLCRYLAGVGLIN